MKLIYSLLFIFCFLAIGYSSTLDTRFSVGSLVLGAQQNAYVSSSQQFLKELRLRTHVDPKEKGAWLWLKGNDLSKSPPFIWLIVGARAKISSKIVTNLQRFIFSGGTLFIEAENDPSARNAMDSLRKKVFYERKGSVLKRDALLTRTYYILPASKARQLKTIASASRILWIESSNPVLKNIKPNHNAQREVSIRTAINIVLYTLTGSYKDDLTHLKYLMRRKKH